MNNHFLDLSVGLCGNHPLYPLDLVPVSYMKRVKTSCSEVLDIGATSNLSVGVAFVDTLPYACAAQRAL